MHDRMIQSSSRNPAMEPMTIPAIAPPDRLFVGVLLPVVTTVVVPCCRAERTLVTASGRVLVGLMCESSRAKTWPKEKPSDAEVGKIGGMINITLYRLAFKADLKFEGYRD